MDDKRLTGYAALFYNILTPLNGLPDFKKQFSGRGKDYIIDSPYWRNAVGIKITEGRISITGIEKEQLHVVLNEKSKSDVYINIPLYHLLMFVNGHASTFTVGFNWLRGLVKAEGLFHVWGLLKLFKYYKNSLSVKE